MKTLDLFRSWRTALLAAAVIACDFGGGGLNQGQNEPGSGEDGVTLSFGDIAIDPQGRYFLSRSGDNLLFGDIHAGAARVLPNIEHPKRLAFGSEDGIVFVTTGIDRKGRVSAYDVFRRTVRWSRTIDQIWEWSAGPRLLVTDDDAFLVVTDQRNVEVLDADTGALQRRVELDNDVVDVDLVPDGSRLIVTLQHDWYGSSPVTKLVSIPIPGGTIGEIDVPNCSDELVLSRDGAFAFLAPTTCARDPVSVIDLEADEWIENLPGFGPVAVPPRGDVLTAFIDLENVDESLFDDPADIPNEADGRYHLMFIDSRDLSFDTLPVGDSLPRYALTPNGKMLLVDSASWFDDGKLRVLDIASREIRSISGPDVRLDDYVITTDSTRVFLLDRGLYDLSIPERLVQSVGLDFVPSNLNITPDDKHLLLRESGRSIWVYDIDSGHTTVEIEAP